MAERDERYRPELREQAIRLYDGGRRTLAEVGELMGGISKQRVSKLIKDGGGEIAPPGPRVRRK